MTRLARGPLARALYLLHRILAVTTGGRADLYVYLFTAKPVPVPELVALRNDPRTAVRPVPPSDPLVALFPRPPGVNKRRFAAGARCHAVTVGSEFAGHLWLSRGVHHEDEVRCCYQLPADGSCVWDFDVYIEPRFRHGRSFCRLWKEVDADLALQGVRWSMSRISLFNLPSVQAHERLGSVQVAAACFLELGPLQVSLWSRSPFVHLGWHSSQWPTIALAAPVGARVVEPGKQSPPSGPAAL